VQQGEDSNSVARHVNFAAVHARNDARAWAAIHERPIPTDAHCGLALSGRPANYAELQQAVESGQDLGFAFSHFLDEFYLFRNASFFAVEPPPFFGFRLRAFLAAVAEFLCHEFSLDVPAWVDQPEYALSEEWDWTADLENFPDELRDRVAQRRDRATPEFRKHNIIYESRNLIRL
jgi:hypothetical protein